MRHGLASQAAIQPILIVAVSNKYRMHVVVDLFYLLFCRDWTEGRQGHGETKGRQAKPDFKQ